MGPSRVLVDCVFTLDYHPSGEVRKEVGVVNPEFWESSASDSYVRNIGVRQQGLREEDRPDGAFLSKIKKCFKKRWLLYGMLLMVKFGGQRTGASDLRNW